MTISRRTFLQTTAAGFAGAALAGQLLAQEKKMPRIRVSTCTLGSNFAQAKAAGLEGIELNVGGQADTLQIARPESIAAHQKQMEETGVAVSSFMMGLLNSYPLATDPRGPQWLDQAIGAAKELKAAVILVAFFGKGSLGNAKNPKTADIDEVVKRVKAAAPKAEDAGVILGLENTLDGKQNAEVLDRIGSKAVKIYYDSYNLAGEHYDNPADIRLLKDRIGQYHFKNGNDYLETGKVKWEPIVAAIKEISYSGWIVLEAAHPSKDGVKDCAKNAEYIRKLFGQA